MRAKAPKGERITLAEIDEARFDCGDIDSDRPDRFGNATTGKAFRRARTDAKKAEVLEAYPARLLRRWRDTEAAVGMLLSERRNELRVFKGGFDAWLRGELRQIERDLRALGLPARCWRDSQFVYAVRDRMVEMQSLTWTRPGELERFIRQHRGKGKALEAAMLCVKARALDSILRELADAKTAFIAGRLFGEAGANVAIVLPRAARRKPPADRLNEKRRKESLSRSLQFDNEVDAEAQRIQKDTGYNWRTAKMQARAIVRRRTTWNFGDEQAKRHLRRARDFHETT